MAHNLYLALFCVQTKSIMSRYVLRIWYSKGNTSSSTLTYNVIIKYIKDKITVLWLETIEIFSTGRKIIFFNDELGNRYKLI